MSGFLWSLVGAVAIIWVAGSILIACFRPWRIFDREDRAIVWLFVFGWLPGAIVMGCSLGLEARLDRRDARRERRRRGG